MFGVCCRVSGKQLVKRSEENLPIVLIVHVETQRNKTAGHRRPCHWHTCLNRLLYSTQVTGCSWLLVFFSSLLDSSRRSRLLNESTRCWRSSLRNRKGCVSPCMFGKTPARRCVHSWLDTSHRQSTWKDNKGSYVSVLQGRYFGTYPHVPKKKSATKSYRSYKKTFIQ